MQLRLVYRALRQISEWALHFYSDVIVEGQENVPEEGPLIIAACHHNEIIDIAALAATIPHRRPLSFWAKASLFKNPLIRTILISSGALPVQRNMDGSRGSAQRHDALFRETFHALDAGEAIGVFPEGTSYTKPQIMLLKEGTARVALEYCRWQHEKHSPAASNEEANAPRKYLELKIVPVGLVYMKKSHYQSSLFVRYGKPIKLDAFMLFYLSDYPKNSRAVVETLTWEIMQQMKELTINAPDWDTLHAANTAFDVSFSLSTAAEGDSYMHEYVKITNMIVNMFVRYGDSLPSSASTKKQLLVYHSLLYHTGMTHASLEAILPTPQWVSRGSVILLFLRELGLTVLHPRFVLGLPVLLLHVPAYILAYAGDRLLSTPGEEETRAQYKAVIGGLGAATVYAVVSRAVARCLIESFPSVAEIVDRLPSELKPDKTILDAMHYIGRFTSSIKLDQVVDRRMVTLGIMYGCTWGLAKWHSAFIRSNLTQFQRLLTSFKLLVGILFPRVTSSPNLQSPSGMNIGNVRQLIYSLQATRNELPTSMARLVSEFTTLKQVRRYILA